MSLCLKSRISARLRHPGRPRRLGVVAVTAVTVVASVLVPGLVQPAGAASKGAYLGIDVAAHQHNGDKPIAWKSVRNAGVRFAFVKATEGAGRQGTVSTNPWFGPDWAGAGSVGIVRGAYHYARPRYPLSTAASDAQRFMSVVHQVPRGELAPVLDLEETGGLSPKDLATWVDTWMRETSRSAGRAAMIYTTRGFWTSYISDTTRFSKYPLWMANHTTNAQPVPLPGGWKAWTFWQYSATGRIAGISGAVDLNWSCGWPGSAPSGSRGSICTTTGSTQSTSSAGATVTATTPSTVKKAVAPSSSTRKSTTSSSSTKKKSTTTSTSSASTKANVAPNPDPPPPPPPPKPLPRPRGVA